MFEEYFFSCQVWLGRWTQDREVPGCRTWTRTGVIFLGKVFVKTKNSKQLPEYATLDLSIEKHNGLGEKIKAHQ